MGSVPYHPIYLFGRVQGGGTPKADAQNWNGSLPFITPTELAGLDGAPVSASERTVTEIGATQSSVIEAGVLVSCRAPIGSIGTTTTKVAFNQGCKGISIPDPVQAKYVAYALIAARPELENRGNGTTFSEISSNSLGQMRIPAPPLPTQRAIANYLDRETAEIDGMRADLDELERLLTERRVSVAALHIFGDSDDSSFPRLSLKMVTDKTFAGEWGKDEGEQQVDRPCVRVADFNRKTNMVSSEVPTIRSYTPKNVAEKTLQTGDLLIEKSGGTNINPVGNVIEYVGPNGPLCSNFIQVVRLNDDQHPRYWQQAHLAAYQTGITNLHVHQTTGIQNLDLTGFTSEKYPAPPLAEQRRIADEIDRETAEIDSMLEDVTKLRDLLAERRAAVISAAVTGQIDIPVSPTYKDEPHA
ncbi:restriction endonuclease subunit S [uncultured Corynebacterium sp.]|uniref:restriction endonuclease subunit S n=1 Tax=uncultured Corynebacterium sp. TaxID=159447 RepID=UPI00259AF657|nr:restriction endonuclease subunit S [uncultured Corynebacterium sp.]